jgi:DAACS family dicarboxylate/amino acid:cation (Na+ or H+) symporter
VTAEIPPPNAAVEEPAAPRLFGLPLYAWVLIAVAAALPVGWALGLDGEIAERWPAPVRATLSAMVLALELIPSLILRGLTAFAAPLIVLAILSAILTNDIRGRQGARMMGFYLLNTLVAMTIGLTLSNVIQPGRPSEIAQESATETRPRLIHVLTGEPPRAAGASAAPAPKTLRDVITDLVPRNLVQAFLENNLAQIVLVTIAVAIALVGLRNAQAARGETACRTVIDLVTVGFEVAMRVLLWIVALVPLAVFGVVATSLARQGVGVFLGLGGFIATVLLGLGLQLVWYLGLLGLVGRIGPRRFLGGASDVMAMTFSTASTAATIPITLRSLTGRLGVGRESSQLAACIGTNFNNDGTALYQAAAALYFAQASGVPLTFQDQLIVMLTTLLASVGAGGIPSGSFVTMPLIFNAVRIPSDNLFILLTVDWFLDRCRTTSNVLGDMTVAVLLDRGRAAGDSGRPVIAAESPSVTSTLPPPEKS